MNYELRMLIPSFIVVLVLIRFWIEVVTTTILKNSAIISSINNNKIGYHHYQLGLVFVLIALVLIVSAPSFKDRSYLLLGFGLALFLDQYTYFLQLFGIKLPFAYRSMTDYLVVLVFVVLLVGYWFYLRK